MSVGAPPQSVPAHDALNYHFSNIEQSVVILQQGDRLVTSCTYNTRYGVPRDMEMGWGRSEELCLAHLLVSPADAILTPYCQSERHDESDAFSCSG